MTIFYKDRECQTIRGSEENYRVLQKLVGETPELKCFCRVEIGIVFENSRETVVPLDELNFSQ